MHPLGRAHGGVSSFAPDCLQISFSKNKELSRIKGLHRSSSLQRSFLPHECHDPASNPSSVPRQSAQPCNVPDLGLPIYPMGQMRASCKHVFLGCLVCSRLVLDVGDRAMNKLMSLPSRNSNASGRMNKLTREGPTMISAFLSHTWGQRGASRGTVGHQREGWRGYVVGWMRPKGWGPGSGWV